MPEKGLEPSHLSALEPHSSVSTNSTTRALRMLNSLPNLVQILQSNVFHEGVFGQHF